ncbi:helix-turn-helix domain-containing protein [Pedobacter sp. GR22-10]|uniref:AlbA family DNA-binding domain-containing protein n=1 Tax=Pedobacter sp. GR22-10 TaxID=2994472 RepID=UPI003A4DA539
MEYKQDIPLSNDQDKREFLYDVSSFANAGAGDLIVGITEDGATGLSNGCPGVEIDNTNEFTRKIENLLRDGIAPGLLESDWSL